MGHFIFSYGYVNVWIQTNENIHIYMHPHPSRISLHTHIYYQYIDYKTLIATLKDEELYFIFASLHSLYCRSVVWGLWRHLRWHIDTGKFFHLHIWKSRQKKKNYKRQTVGTTIHFPTFKREKSRLAKVYIPGVYG